ncbi:MAG TPA: site-2 protease family protein [Candidatus Tumulicola sp.]|nr:site-2 protease family protein [Candidatus Tumulicola sp.]
MDYLPPPEPHEPAPPPARRTPTSALGAALAAALAFLLKFKLLLLVGLKLLAPSWTFLLTLWIYVVIFGWRLAVVVILLLLAHELGHYFAFRAYGLPARLPVFAVFGAFTAGAPPQNLEDDAHIALAGPLVGLGLAAACLAIGASRGDRFWYACADLSAFLNLFNMIPMPPFDGGRVVAALWPPLWLVGIALLLAFAFLFHVPIFFVILVAVLGLPSILAALKGHVDPRSASMTLAARVRVSLWYLATLLGLFVVLARAHAGAAAPATGGAIW